MKKRVEGYVRIGRYHLKGKVLWVNLKRTSKKDIPCTITYDLPKKRKEAGR